MIEIKLAGDPETVLRDINLLAQAADTVHTGPYIIGSEGANKWREGWVDGYFTIAPKYSLTSPPYKEGWLAGKEALAKVRENS